MRHNTSETETSRFVSENFIDYFYGWKTDFWVAKIFVRFKVSEMSIQDNELSEQAINSKMPESVKSSIRTLTEQFSYIAAIGYGFTEKHAMRY